MNKYQKKFVKELKRRTNIYSQDVERKAKEIEDFKKSLRK